MYAFLFVSLFPLFALFLGIKALMPSGVELWEGRRLSRRASNLIGVATITFSLLVIGGSFAYFVLRLPIPML